MSANSMLALGLAGVLAVGAFVSQIARPIPVVSPHNAPRSEAKTLSRAQPAPTRHVYDAVPFSSRRPAEVPAAIRPVAFAATQSAPLTPPPAVLSDTPKIAVARGHDLFVRRWKSRVGGTWHGDGLGPLYNDVSCVACHSLGGKGGAGPAEKNIVLRSDKHGTQLIHHFGTSPVEHVRWRAERLLQLDVTYSLTESTASQGGLHVQPVRLSQRNSSALFGVGLIDALTEKELIEVERASKSLLPSEHEGNEPYQGRRVGRFGWKGQVDNLREFIKSACTSELGLNLEERPAPTAPCRTKEWEQFGVKVRFEPVSRPADLSRRDFDALTAYVRQLPRPVTRTPDDWQDLARAERGERRFGEIGCAKCHLPSIGSVHGLYSDLLLHDMGEGTSGLGFSYADTNPMPFHGCLVGRVDPAGAREWRTPPLWGCRDSAPYLHDGRAATLEQAIRLHGGQGRAAAQAFQDLSPDEQSELLLFLNTLTAPTE